MKKKVAETSFHDFRLFSPSNPVVTIEHVTLRRRIYVLQCTIQSILEGSSVWLLNVFDLENFNTSTNW